MGAGLYRSEPVFRAEMDRCAEILQPSLVRPARNRFTQWVGSNDAARLDQTQFTQPALFAFGYALARLWMSWGVQPAAMLGHSVGEYVAACLAGVFSLEDALRLVAERARLVQAQPGGAMLAVRLPEAELLPALWQTPDSKSRPSTRPVCAWFPARKKRLSAFEKELETRRVAARRLKTSHAFHSAMVEPVVEPFAALVRTV